MRLLKSYAALLLVIITVAMAACTKEDIMPAPVGEPVPYKPAANRNWKAIMETPDFSSFNAAWKRSDMDSWVANSSSMYHTLFIPTNQAMTNAGWTTDRINAAPAAELDSLLSYYVIAGSYNPSNLQTGLNRSMVLRTLLKKLDVPGYPSATYPYNYKLRVGTYNDSLMVNGKTIGKWEEAEEATNGCVYKLHHMVNKPTQTMYDYVKNDPRFTMLLMAMEVSRPYYAIEWQDYQNPEYIQFLQGNMALQSTLFLPTNQAFANSGYTTEQQLKDRLEGSLPIGYPDSDPETQFYLTPVTAIDSMFLPHGFSLKEIGAQSDQYNPGGIDMVFYKNDLLNKPSQLSGFLYKPGQPGYGGNQRLVTSFANQNGTVMVRDWGSPNAGWQPLVETDIECINGVIHVVNDFLMRP